MRLKCLPWERTVLAQKTPGEGGHFPLRLSHDSLRETKITPVDVDHVSARALVGQIFH